MAIETGFNETAAQAAINEIISGGADVRLMTTELGYGDVATNLDSKEVAATDYSPVSVPKADWELTFDAANATVTLTNTAQVDFGTAQNDYGVVLDVAIHAPGTDKFIRADEVNDPDITAGEDIRFPAGEITYTLGD